MGKIEVLDQHTIDKIAAGEVVERPASVVKELVENAIDAGASLVTVEIQGGGRSLIRVTDNGSGIETGEIGKAFLSHATSKLRKVEDLYEIHTMGFRGEALSSIAAVSKVELVTKTLEAPTGARFRIEGGVPGELEEVGANEGTTILVRDLFFNTPARAKFLKTDAAEAAEVGSLLEQLALSHPDVGFRFLTGGQVKLQTPGSGQVKDVIYNVYGREITKALLPVSYANDLLEVSGFIGKPDIARGNRTYENYCVNSRFVRNNILAKAIEDAYKGYLMQHKFPFVMLDIRMDGREVDVNVHPRKLEVRFSRGPEVYDAIYEAVRNALTGRELITHVTPGKESPTGQEQTQPQNQNQAQPQPQIQPQPQPRPQPQSQPQPQTQTHAAGQPAPVVTAKPSPRITLIEEEPIPYEAPKEQEAKPTKEEAPKGQKAEPTKEQETKPTKKEPPRIVISTAPPAGMGPRISTANPEGPTQEELEEAKQESLDEERFISPTSRKRHRLIGKLFETYWLVEFEDTFYMIDQHAAHEKVYYERFVKRFREQEVASQNLVPPLIVSLRIEEEAVLNKNAGEFKAFGFEIEHYGGREYCIRAVPTNLYGFDEEELFHEMLENLRGEKKGDPLEIFAMRLATMACKAAVKGGDKLSVQEADALIDELLNLENPYNCPHGRPTIIAMTRAEIEKKFHRIV